VHVAIVIHVLTDDDVLQMLAMLFKKKRHLLNSHILHLTFSLVGTLDSGRETSSIPHKAAFENLLCDLEVKQTLLLACVHIGTVHFLLSLLLFLTERDYVTFGSLLSQFRLSSVCL